MSPLLPTPDPQFLKTDSIILRRFEYSETSLVMSLLTRDRGTISVLAKGARRAKSIFEGEIDLLACGQAVVLLRKPGGLHLLTEFSCRERHLPLRTSGPRSVAALYASEICGDASPEEICQPEIFDLLQKTLFNLQSEDYLAALAAFQVQLLALSGYMPDLTHCISCGHSLTGNILYSFRRPGPLCPACRGIDEPVRQVTQATVALVNSLSRTATAASLRISIPPVLSHEAIPFLAHVLAAVFEREARMLQPLLRSLRASVRTGCSNTSNQTLHP